ncbi:hypothetical protein D3C76_1643230 [compost metagenome]
MLSQQVFDVVRRVIGVDMTKNEYRIRIGLQSLLQFVDRLPARRIDMEQHRRFILRTKLIDFR